MKESQSHSIALTIDIDRASPKAWLTDATELACQWVVEVAQIKTEKLTIEQNSNALRHENWKGAIRGEYFVLEKQWDMYCPIWHTGQAVKSLAMVSKVFNKPQMIDSARLGGEFIVNNQIKDGPDEGLILGYEDHGDKINTSAVLECLDGLFWLSKVTGESRWSNAAIKAVDWVMSNAWRQGWDKGGGLLCDSYNPVARKWHEHALTRSKAGDDGRPLSDDGVFYTAYKLTGNEKYLELFLDVSKRLRAEEYPSGNWIDYAPCSRIGGTIHARQAYWWGRPLLRTYEHTGDESWLNIAIRCGQWYLNAQRNDGGMFKRTSINGKTDSFGHATSASACAGIFYLDLYEATKDKKWLDGAQLSLQFCRSMQFTKPQDPNLKGAILEKVHRPDGTENIRYHVRDLATIFFLQLAARWHEIVKGD